MEGAQGTANELMEQQVYKIRLTGINTGRKCHVGLLTTGSGLEVFELSPPLLVGRSGLYTPANVAPH
jgi:hypothetical protein